MVNEEQYTHLAHEELLRLVDALDELDTDSLEVELESDILTLEFEDGTKYVINSHRAARQIWMAADHSAWHFDWRAERSAWIASKSGDELWATVERVAEKKLGQPVRLVRPAA